MVPVQMSYTSEFVLVITENVPETKLIKQKFTYWSK